MDELLGEDFVLAEKNRLYRCLDKLLNHKEDLFLHLQKRWRDMFGVNHEILLYDLTITYFEGEMEEYDKAKHGYSRDGRPDCRQVVIALVVTREGFPLSDQGEVYVLAKSTGRKAKEMAMRKSRLKKLWKTLNQIQKSKNLKRDTLLLRLGVAKKEAGKTFRIVDIHLPKEGEEVNSVTFHFSLNKDKLRKMRRHEGQYLLRTNLTEENPAVLWKYYIQLTEVEAAFKCLKSDLAIRPIYHKVLWRIEAHIFVAFISYCLMVTLKKRLSFHAPGLTPRSALEKFSEIQMLDVHIPTSDGRHIIMPRYTQPEKDLELLLEKLNLKLPAQPPPRIYSQNSKKNCGEDLEKNMLICNKLRRFYPLK